MTSRPPGSTYLSSPASLSLRATFVTNIRRVLEEQGYVRATSTQGKPAGTIEMQQLAADSSLPIRTLENLLAANNQPTLVGAAQLCRTLSVSLDAMLGTPGDYMPAAPSGSSTLECIHTDRHTPGRPVCDRCLATWRAMQGRLSSLWEEQRRAHNDEWDAGKPAAAAALTPCPECGAGEGTAHYGTCPNRIPGERVRK